LQKKILVLHIFDVAKAREFYIEWRGFKIVWEQQFEALKINSYHCPALAILSNYFKPIFYK